MRPFDDSIPEEIEPQQQELLTLLQHAYARPAPLMTGEQEQLLARVRERLLSAPANLTEVDIPDEELPIEENTLPAQPIAGRRGQIDRAQRWGQHPRVVQLLNSLAAVVVLGAVISAALLLFSHRPQSQPAAGGSDGTILADHSSAGGLEMSLYLTPGPYFLSEMLAVDITLTNSGNTPYYIGIPFTSSPCGYTSGINTTGGGAPHYNITVATDHSCPAGIGSAAVLNPGQTLTAHKYQPLLDSGHVTLTAYTSFFSKNGNNGFRSYNPIDGPFADHWPSTKINVNSKIPADLQLSYKINGTHVIVSAPPAAQSHLLYLYDIECQDFSDSGTTGTGNFGWESITSNQVSLPGCPGKNPQWDFAFAAPGYAIVIGNYPPTANHA